MRMKEVKAASQPKVVDLPKLRVLLNSHLQQLLELTNNCEDVSCKKCRKIKERAGIITKI